MATTDWTFVSFKDLPSRIKTYLDVMCDLRDVDACMNYVIRQPSDFQLAALKHIFHELELRPDEEIPFLQKYLEIAPAVHTNGLLKIHVQFLLGFDLGYAKRLNDARRVYEEILRQLEEESPMDGEQVIRLLVKVEKLFIRIQENPGEQENGADVDVLPDNEYRELWAELEHWLSNEEQRERLEFENYFPFRSLRMWIRIVEHNFRKNPTRTSLMDWIEWMRRTEKFAALQPFDAEFLTEYDTLLRALYGWEGEELVEEMQEFVGKLKSTFDRICKELRLIEPSDLHKARRIVKHFGYFISQVMIRITNRRNLYIRIEELVAMGQTTLLLARVAHGAHHPKVASLLVSLLPITYGDEQLEYEELSVRMLDTIDNNLIENRQNMPDASFVETLFYSHLHIGSYFQRSGRREEAMRHFQRASEINKTYPDIHRDETYNKLKKDLLKRLVQFLLGFDPSKAKRLNDARWVCVEILRQLEEESPMHGEQAIRLLVKVQNLFLRIQENLREQESDADVDVLPDNEYRELWAELEHWLSNEEQRERLEFENFLFRSLLTWISIVEHNFRKNPTHATLMDWIEWMRRSEKFADLQAFEADFLTKYCNLLQALYGWEGGEMVEEFREFMGKFESRFNRISQELQLIELVDLHKARRLVEHFVHFISQVIVRISNRRNLYIRNEQLVGIGQTALRLARVAHGAHHPKVASLLVSLLRITSGDEQHEYEEVSVRLLETIDKDLNIENGEKKPNSSFVETLFYSHLHLGSHFRRSGKRGEAKRHFLRASEIIEKYSDILGEETYNELEKDLLKKSKQKGNQKE